MRQVGPLKKTAYLFEALAAIWAGMLVSLLPRSGFAFVSRVGGILAYHLDRRDRNWAYANLDIVVADRTLSKAQKDRIVKRLFANLVLLALEYLRFRSVREEKLPFLFQAEGLQNVEQALAEGKGVLVYTAHLGNWEYMGAAAAQLGYPVSTVIKRQHNPYMDRWLRRIRERRAGVRCLYETSGLLSRVGSHLRRNGILAILVDQAYISKALLVPFFGVPCATASGAAKLHLWFEAPIIIAYSLRLQSGKYLLRFLGPFHFERESDLQEDCKRIMVWVYGKLEAPIREHPDQWFSLLTPRWFHRPPEAEMSSGPI